MGGIPGIVPGQMVFGHSSLFAGAPNITGGILIIAASSFGNLKPASLNAFPKSFSLGKSMWQVLQLVPYIRANAGMARAVWERPKMAVAASNTRWQLRNDSNCFSFRARPALLCTQASWFFDHLALMRQRSVGSTGVISGGDPTNKCSALSCCQVVCIFRVVQNYQ